MMTSLVIEKAWSDEARRRSAEARRKKPVDRLREQEKPTVLGYELDPKTLTPVRDKVDFNKPGDYGADPLEGGTKFRMVPSGDIVDIDERNRRLKKVWSDEARRASVEARRARARVEVSPAEQDFVQRMNRIITNEIEYRHRARQKDAQFDRKFNPKPPGVVSKTEAHMIQSNQVDKAWTDEARRASAEARRRKGIPGPKSIGREIAERHGALSQADRMQAGQARDAFLREQAIIHQLNQHRSVIVDVGARAAAEIEGPTLARRGGATTYTHRTSGKEIVSTRHPGKDWMKKDLPAPVAALYNRISTVRERIEDMRKAWTDEARRASAEARRRRAGVGYDPRDSIRSSVDTAVSHGFNDNISGGAGSDEYSHPKLPGHAISVDTRENPGSWVHVKGMAEDSDGVEIVASGKNAASLDRHLRRFSGVKKAWTDEARRASAEARRRKGGWKENMGHPEFPKTYSQFANSHKQLLGMGYTHEYMGAGKHEYLHTGKYDPKYPKTLVTLHDPEYKMFHV